MTTEGRNHGFGVNGVIRRVLLLVFVVALVGGSASLYFLLRHNAMERASDEARILLATALGIRSYTVERILPKLSQLDDGIFHRETVPSFSATTIFKSVATRHPAYTYREAALNPTNPENRAIPFEVEIIRRFRSDEALHEITGIRNNGDEDVFFLASPLTVSEPKCLSCHATPDRAPVIMLAEYGTSNGFGWILGETIGLQILTVPVSHELRRAVEIVLVFAVGLFAVFAFAYLALSLSLDAMVVRPMRVLITAAEVASQTSAAVELPKSGAREIRHLAAAIERLHESLRKALRDLSTDSTYDSGGQQQ